jgi:hypothetical protein
MMYTTLYWLLMRAERVEHVMLSEAKHLAGTAGGFLAALGMTAPDVFRSG